MRRPHPFIGKTHDELDGRRWKGGRAKGLGPAEHLLDVLKAKQTSPDGKVYYHRTITYRWIRSLIPHPPPKRTLERWMATLIERGEIASSRRREGFKLRLVNSRKWATQLSLFAPPAVRVFPSVRDRDRETLRASDLPGSTSRRPGSPVRSVEKAVDNRNRESPKVADLIRHKWRTKEVREPIVETSNTRAHKPRALPVENKTAESERRQAMKARRILGEIQWLRESCVGNGGFTESDRQALARRDRKLELLYAQLQTTGWQEERAG